MIMCSLLLLCLSIWVLCRMLLCRRGRIDCRRFNPWWFRRSECVRWLACLCLRVKFIGLGVVLNRQWCFQWLWMRSRDCPRWSSPLEYFGDWRRVRCFDPVCSGETSGRSSSSPANLDVSGTDVVIGWRVSQWGGGLNTCAGKSVAGRVYSIGTVQFMTLGLGLVLFLPLTDFTVLFSRTLCYFVLGFMLCWPINKTK